MAQISEIIMLSQHLINEALNEKTIIITISRVVVIIFSDGNSERKGLNLISKEHKEQCCHMKGKAEDEHNRIEGEVETLYHLIVLPILSS